MATETENLHLMAPELSDKVSESIPNIADAFSVLDKMLPVGIIWPFGGDANPNEMFPGTTWTQLHDVFLVASGTSFPQGSTGGEKDHQHLIPLGFDENTFFMFGKGGPAYGSIVNIENTRTFAMTPQQQGYQRIAYTERISNLPPYRSVNMWERTA